MTISAISSAVTATQLPTTPTLPATGQVGWSGGVGAVGDLATTSTSGAAGSQGFGQLMSKALDNLQGAQAKADRLAVDAASGNLTNVHDYMIAATEASLATDLTVAVRNKAVDAFNQIMNMGV